MNVKIDLDTTGFVIECFRRWFEVERSKNPRARSVHLSVLIPELAFGRNVPVEIRTALVADETKFAIRVSLLPLGTSKWHNIEHRLSSCGKVTPKCAKVKKDGSKC